VGKKGKEDSNETVEGVESLCGRPLECE